MKRSLTFTFVFTLSLLLGLAYWSARPRQGAQAAMQATYPLNPASFTSLGASPFGAAGTYAINASKSNATPILTKPDNTTINGVFFNSSGGEIAVFTFDTINIPANVTVQGLRNANSRPVALLSKGSFTLAGTVDVSGDDSNVGALVGITLNPAAGANAGPGGGGGGGTGDAAGGLGFVNGAAGAAFTGSGRANGGAGGSVGASGGGGGGNSTWFDGGGGGFGGNGGTSNPAVTAGTAYGNLATTLQGGSGGGGPSYTNIGFFTYLSGAGGGGAIEIGASAGVTITGRLRANGGNSPGNITIYGGGAGAGGGILMHGSTVDFSGAQEISAHGGSDYRSAGGGGGRVHVIGNTINEGCVDVGGGPGAGVGVYTLSGARTLRLNFDQQPTNTNPQFPFNPVVKVSVRTACGPLPDNTTSITLALGNNPSGATLGGTLTKQVVNGVATFDDLTVSKVGTGYTLIASSSGLSNLTSDSFNVVCQTLSFATNPLDDGTLGTTYAGAVFPTPFGPTYNFTVTQGALPGGLALTNPHPIVYISGTPTVSGTFDFTIKMEHSNGCSISQAFQIIIACPSFTVGTPTGTGAFGQSYNSSAAASPAAPSGYKYQYSLANGTALPSGLTLNSTTGAITGSPTVGGNFSFDIKADLLTTGNVATGCSDTKTRSINISCPSFTVGTPTGTGTVGTNYNSSATVGSAAPSGYKYQYSLVNNSTLPNGLTLNADTGAISGTPSVSGNVSFDLKAELLTTGNVATGCSDTKTRSINISCPSFTVGTPLNTGALGLAYSGSVVASPAAPSGFKYQYSPANNTTLPGGLMLDANTGAITGTPTAGGNFSFDLKAELLTTGDAATGCSSTQTRTINVTCISNPVVTNLNDSGAGSLREAITQACAGSTITFAPGLTGTITLTSGDLIISRTLTIQGPGAQVLTISGNQQWRIFTLFDTTPASLTISGLSLRNGNGGSTVNPGIGGAIYYAGTPGNALTLTDVAIADNTSGFGGGVYAYGNNATITVLRSTIAGNVSQSQGGGLALEGNGLTANLMRSTFSGNTASAIGGGILIRMNGTVNVVNCTIAGNQAPNAQGGGIGIAINVQASVNLVNSTITNNQGGGLRLLSLATANVRNTLLALNSGADAFVNGGTFISSGYNLFGTGVPAGAVQATDQVGVDPLLELDGNGKPLLANNGGPTQTIKLLPGSPALDAGAAATDPVTNQSLTSDQRGLPRPADLSNPNAGGGDGSDIGAYEHNCAPLTLAALPNGTANTTYNQSLNPGGGFAPYTVTHTAGTLPPGLTINGDSLSGVPTATGAFNFTLQVTDAYGCTGSRSYTLTFACAGVTVVPTNLPGGTVGTAYNQTIGTSPTGAFSFAVTSGALPIGLMLNAATGAITGTPTQSGSFSFTITATGAECSGSRGYTIAIGCPVITLAALSNTTVGAGYAGSVAASPNGVYSYSLLTGSLPAGLTLNVSNGALTGTASVPGTFGFTIRAQSAKGCGGQQSYTLTVGCPTIVLSALVTPTLNSPYQQTVVASPGGGNYSYVLAGSLPAGLSLNAATGVISGTPTAAGAYNFTITANGFGTCSGSRNYIGTIAGSSCPTIALADLPNGQPGQLYSNSVAATPAGSYSYAVTTGSLPPGLTLYGSFGLIYGFPTTAGSFDFTITATDANNCTGAKSYSLLIGGASVRSLVFGDFDGDGKADLSVWRGQSGEWLTINSKDNKAQSTVWGSSAAPYFDVPAPGDYDGDGKMDWAVFRRGTGEWFIKGSRDGAVTTKLWGLGTDVPVPGDYDGDGKTDIAVWRGSDTHWYIVRSSDGQTQTVAWGTSKAPYQDVPVAADYDGDGKTDIAVFRQANGHWYIRLSSSNEIVDKAWGLGSDVPVAADYDGDGRADIAVWRGAEGNWYIIKSSDGAVQSLSLGSSVLGDVPAPGDFDGDGKADPTVWRAKDGRWYINGSRDGKVVTQSQGTFEDIPVIMKAKP